MPRATRLSRRDFETLGRSPRTRVNGTYFFLTVAPSPRGRGVQVAYVVSKKVSPLAHVRNRIKRRCRGIVRNACAKRGCSGALVFTARREAASASYAELRSDIERLLERV